MKTKILLLFLFFLFFGNVLAEQQLDEGLKVIDTDINITFNTYPYGENETRMNLTITTEQAIFEWGELNFNDSLSESHRLNLIRELRCEEADFINLSKTCIAYFERYGTELKTLEECTETRGRMEQTIESYSNTMVDLESAQSNLTSCEESLAKCDSDLEIARSKYDSCEKEKAECLNTDLKKAEENKMLWGIGGLVLGIASFYFYNNYDKNKRQPKWRHKQEGEVGLEPFEYKKEKSLKRKRDEDEDSNQIDEIGGK